MNRIRRHGSWIAVFLTLALAACGDDAGTNQNQTADHARLAVSTAQISSGGGLTVIDLETLEASVNVALTEDDATIRWGNGQIWVLNRFGYDNVMILRGTDYGLVKQFTLKRFDGDSCNPQDIVILSATKAYVSCLQHENLLVVDPTRDGSEVVGGVDLSSLADADGWPEPTFMRQVGDEVIVAIERIDQSGSYAPVAPSRIAVVDPATDTLVDSFDLASLNPTSRLVPLPGSDDLFVATSGNYSGGSAGLERIDPIAGTSTLVLDATELGGLVAAFTLEESGCGFAVTMAPTTYQNALVRFCLTGATVEPCVAPGTFGMTDVLQADDGRLLVTDTSVTAPGVRIFDPDTCDELTTEVIGTGFAPTFTNPLLLLPTDH
jgi:hypothetical protein